MVARETNIVNAFETTLAAQLASGGTSMNLANDPGIDSPAYFVIDPDNDSNREVVLWSTGSNHAAATVTRDIDSKHGTDPTHAAGTKVRLAVVKQHIEEAHDAIQQGFILEDGNGDEVTINPAVASGVYTQREVKFVEGGGIDIDWTDTDNGTDGDPFDLTFTVNVDTAEIAADAITGAKIADDAVDSEHLVDGSIDTAHLGDLQVTTAKIAADAVTAAKIADDVVGSEHIAAGAVDTTALGADAVTEAKIADDAVESEHLNDNVISGQTDLASGLALTDELLISDAGTLKKGDISLIADAIDGDGIDVSSGTLVNAAIGKQSIWIPAAAMNPTATNGCADIAKLDSGGNTGPDLYTLDFAGATANENAQFAIAFPSYWNEGTVTFKAYWTSEATDTDGVVWELKGVALADSDSLNTAFGTGQHVDDANIGTAKDLHITAESSAITIAGSPAAGELCYFNIARLQDDGSDTAAEDAKLIGIKIFYTVDDVHEA